MRREQPRDVSLEEDHGDESGEPEFDEALDRERGATEFRDDSELDQVDMHEVDHDLRIYE